MSLFRTLVVSLCAATVAVATPVLASPKGQQLAWLDRPRDQDRAFRELQQGRSMPLPLIERRVKPTLPGADYLGPEIRGGTYRLKFMQDGRVIWVDVDAQTGRVVGRSGH